MVPALLLVCAVQGVRAQTTWDAGTAAWNAPGSWTPDEPTAGDDFYINNAGTAQITGGIDAVGNVGTLGDLVGESGSLSISGGSLTVSELRVGNAGTGTLNLDGGVLTAGQVSKGSGAGSVTFNGGTLQMGAAQAALFDGFDTVSFAAGGATINTQGFATTSNANFTGAGGFTKTGAGTLTLWGNSDYTGPTTVMAGGFLRVEGSITSATTVESGATFGGDGVVGDITLESGSTLIPIDCFDGINLTWKTDATMVFGIGDNDFNILELTGDLLKDGDGTYAFTFIDAEWQVGNEYELIIFEGTTTFDESDFSFTNIGGFAGAFTIVDNSVRFTPSAVPEPATWALGLAGLLVVVVGARRRAKADCA